MKRIIFLTVIFLISHMMFSQYYVRGDHNGWGITNPLTQRSDIAGGSTYFTVIQASNDQEFKIANENFSNEWGSGYWITDYNQRWDIGSSGANAIWKGSISTYTQINSLNPVSYIGNNLPTGIMTLSAIPIGVSSVSQIGTDIGGGIYQVGSTSAQTVNITLSGSKSPDENVYLRYSTNGWTSSSFVLASGSGNAYTALIPGQTNGTTVSYYVLTTTLTYSTGNHLDLYTDLMTLNYNTNSGSNYNYTVNLTLPVELISFDAQIKGNNTLLNWKTVSENINSYYEIHRSNDGEIFNSIGKIPTSGNLKDIKNYQFYDYEPYSDVNYYRLKLVEDDGNFEFSKIIVVDFSDNRQNKMIVVPTLAESGITCYYDNPVESGELIIYNMLGKEIKREKITNYTDNIYIDLSDLKNGQYILQYKGEFMNMSSKFIKQ